MVDIVNYLCLIVLYVTASNACSCAKFPDESKPHFLCCKDYVFRGELENETLVGNDSMPDTLLRLYTVKVQTIFKGLEQIKKATGGNTSYLQIRTHQQGSACGVTIPLHKDLVISGFFHNKKIDNSRCSGWHEEWHKLSDKFKSFFPQLETCKCAASVSRSSLSLQGLLLLVLLLGTYTGMY